MDKERLKNLSTGAAPISQPLKRKIGYGDMRDAEETRSATQSMKRLRLGRVSDPEDMDSVMNE